MYIHTYIHTCIYIFIFGPLKTSSWWLELHSNVSIKALQNSDDVFVLIRICSVIIILIVFRSTFMQPCDVLAYIICDKTLVHLTSVDTGVEQHIPKERVL